MELRESAEIIQAGIAWAGWNDEQNEAMKVALKTMQLFEKQQKEIEQLKVENEKLKRALTDISEIDYLSLPKNRHFLKLQDAVVMAESMLDDLYNR